LLSLSARLRRGQFIILLAIMYLTAVLQVMLFLPKFEESTNTGSTVHHFQLNNLIIRRCVESSVAWASLGGNFSEYLDWSLRVLSNELPLIVKVCKASLKIVDGECSAIVLLEVYDFAYEAYYKLRVNVSLAVRILGIEVLRIASIPTFKSVKLKVQVSSEESVIINSEYLNFTIAYFNGTSWVCAPTMVEELGDAFLVSAQIDAMASSIVLYVGDWREIIVKLKIEI